MRWIVGAGPFMVLRNMGFSLDVWLVDSHSAARAQGAATDEGCVGVPSNHGPVDRRWTILLQCSLRRELLHMRRATDPQLACESHSCSPPTVQDRASQSSGHQHSRDSGNTDCGI